MMRGRHGIVIASLSCSSPWSFRSMPCCRRAFSTFRVRSCPVSSIQVEQGRRPARSNGTVRSEIADLNAGAWTCFRRTTSPAGSDGTRLGDDASSFPTFQFPQSGPTTGSACAPTNQDGRHPGGLRPRAPRAPTGSSTGSATTFRRVHAAPTCGLSGYRQLRAGSSPRRPFSTRSRNSICGFPPSSARS